MGKGNRRVSDPSWTKDERREVLRVFLERSSEALQGPIFEYGDGVKDPNGGTSIKGKARVNRRELEKARNTPGTRIKVQYIYDFPDFGNEQYLLDVTRLRPFMLSQQDIFLPKVTQHMILLAREKFIPHLEDLNRYVKSNLDFGKEFSPNFFYLYESLVDGKSNISTSSSKIALSYIYGILVKTDLDKRAFIRQLQKNQSFEVKFALVSFIQQLMRLAYTVRHELVALDEHDGFTIRIQDPQLPDTIQTRLQ